MTQELGDELSRVLRERGPIDTVLDRFERQTKLRREYLVYGAAGIVAIMFAMDWMSAYLCQSISTVIGVLGCLRALERQDPATMQKWTAYWLIYVILNYYLGFAVRFVGHYFKKNPHVQVPASHLVLAAHREQRIGLHLQQAAGAPLIPANRDDDRVFGAQEDRHPADPAARRRATRQDAPECVPRPPVRRRGLNKTPGQDADFWGVHVERRWRSVCV
uniref:Receptor expression-enhancing protein 5/6 n=1 Tax=Rhipicephalus zambeziensis TaxID=60191 RepID=A0A224YXR5_9ACAR